MLRAAAHAQTHVCWNMFMPSAHCKQSKVRMHSLLGVCPGIDLSGCRVLWLGRFFRGVVTSTASKELSGKSD